MESISKCLFVLQRLHSPLIEYLLDLSGWQAFEVDQAVITLHFPIVAIKNRRAAAVP